MKLFPLLIGALLSSQFCRATNLTVESSSTCEERLAWYDRSALVLSRGYLKLPPLSHRYLTAATLETAEGEPLLAVGGYRSQHIHIEEAASLLNEWLPNPLPGPFTFKWLGELLIVNPSDQVAVGQVGQLRKGSGHWNRKLRKDGVHSNRIAHAIRHVLRTPLVPQGAQPRLISDWRSISPRDPHLFPGLDRFVNTVRALVARGELPGDETPRHLMLTHATVILGKLSMLVTLREHDYAGLLSTIAEIRTRLSNPLIGMSFALYLQILDNDSVDANCVRELRRFLEMQLETPELPIDEWCYAGVIAKEFSSTVIPASDELIADVEIFSLAN